MPSFFTRHPTRVKAVAGAVFWLLAAVFILLDADDGALGILSAVACLLLATGLAMIILGVIDWQAERIRKTMWLIADVFRETDPQARRLRSVGRR